MLKKTLYVITGGFIAANFVLGFTGASSVFLTISFYSLLWFTVNRLISVFNSNKPAETNIKLLASTLIVSLLAAELVLKYVVHLNLNYSERNGKFLYESAYRKKDYFNFKWKKTGASQDPQLFINKPNTSKVQQNAEFSYLHQFNSLGLRGVEPVMDTSKFTIIGLGDSFTEGMGAPQDSTWLSILQHKLNENDSLGVVQCINAGVSGSDLFYEYILLERQLLKFHPRLVIVAINNSDIDDIMVRGGMERFNNKGTVTYRKGPWWEFFYQFSFITRAVAHSLFKVDWRLMTAQQLQQERMAAIKEIELCLRQYYKPLAQAHNFKLMVVLHPLQNELEKDDFLLQPLYNRLRSDSTVTIVNLFTEIQNLKGEVDFKSLYWQLDMHYNSKGYALWADVLKNKIER